MPASHKETWRKAKAGGARRAGGSAGSGIADTVYKRLLASAALTRPLEAGGCRDRAAGVSSAVGEPAAKAVWGKAAAPEAIPPSPP